MCDEAAYYPETDSLYIELTDAPGAKAREIAQGLDVDLDADGNVVGFGIDHASRNAICPRSRRSHCPRDRGRVMLPKRGPLGRDIRDGPKVVMRGLDPRIPSTIGQLVFGN